jgi:hypothetical protein
MLPPAEGRSSFSRRRAAAAALLLPQAGAALLAAAWQGACLQAGAAEQPSSSASKASFYSEYPYIQPSDILPFLRDKATPGDMSSVLAAIDDFAAFYPMYRSVRQPLFDPLDYEGREGLACLLIASALGVGAVTNNRCLQRAAAAASATHCLLQVRPRKGSHP